MKKPTKTTSTEAGARSPDRGGGHEWQGEGVERGSAPSSHEQPELAAARAEGNAPSPAGQARHRQRVEGDPTDFDVAGRDEDDDAEVSPDDDATAAELKRQAAAEEHASSTSKHAPHGRL